MTHRTLFSTAFAPASKRKVHADFTGGEIASDGGLVLLREVDKATRLTSMLSKCIPEARQRGKIQHPLKQLLAQRIFAIAAGYEDGIDHNDLRHDPLFQLCAARPGKQLGSAATLSRFENRVDRASLLRMQGVFVQHFLDAHIEAPKEIVIDLDATDTTLHGKQEGRSFNAYYDSYCFLPLYITCGKFLLCAWLRESGRDPAHYSLLLLKPIISMIRERWPKTKIIVRADSGFQRDWLMGWCEANGIGYLLGLARNKRLRELATELRWEAEAYHDITGRKGRVIGEFRYRTLRSWPHPRRVIARVEHTEKGENPRYIVTNVKGSPRRLYDLVYCQRGDMENRIKEVQKQLFANRASCSQFLANQLRLTLACAAYVLMHDLRRLGCEGTVLANAEMATLRVKLLKIGARIKVSCRRFLLELSESYPLKALFQHVAKQLRSALLSALPAGP